MEKRWLTSAVVAAVVASSIVMVAPASASPSRGPSAASAADRAESLLTGVDRTTQVFDGAAATRAGATTEDVEDFAAGYVAGGGAVENVEVSEETVSALRAPAAALRSCSGRNSADVTGLQANLYLNSCNTNKLVAALAGGAGVAALVGVITAATGVGGAAGGIAAALLTIGSAAVAYCGARGRGIGFHVLPVGPPWCRSQ